MRKAYTFSLLIAAVVICGACSNVRQAPVEDRRAPAAAPVPVTEAATAPPVTGAPVGKPAREEEDAQWEELPGSVESIPVPSAQAGRFSDNAAVMALLADAELWLSQGDPEVAALSVERALRLEPKNPWLWHRLAVLKLEQGQPRQAVALAQKSNSLSAERPALRKANAALIERAQKYQQQGLK